MGLKLVVFDCDGVLVDVVSSWEFIHDHFGASNAEAVQAYMRGDIDGMEFMRRDIALWRAREPEITIQRIKGLLMKIPPMEGLDELARALKAHGCKAVIISGGLDLLVEDISRKLGAVRGYSNGLEADGRGRLTGEGILRVEPKDKRGPLLEVMRELGLKKKDVAAVGDTAGDATMFRDVGLAVAFNPQDGTVRKMAHKVIEKKDLRELIDVLF